MWRNLYTGSQLLIKVDFTRMRCRQSRVYRAGTGMAKNKVRIYKSVVLLYCTADSIDSCTVICLGGGSYIMLSDLCIPTVVPFFLVLLDA